MKVAVIPARQGSNRIKNKNVKEFLGKPLLLWTIEAAMHSKQFDYIVLSSDDLRAIQIAEDSGIHCNGVRPANLCTDDATTNDVINYEIKMLEDNEKITVENVCLLQPTSPLRNSTHIIHAYNLFSTHQPRALVSVCELGVPLEYCGYFSYDNDLNNFVNVTPKSRSQNYQKSYRLNGAIFILSRALIGQMNELYTKGTLPFVMDRMVSIDIDDDTDWDMAEYIMSGMQQGKP